MKIQFTLLLVLFVALFATAQESAEFMLHEKNGKVYLEASVFLNEVETYITQADYCEQGTSTSFCFRNYLNEKLDVSVNGGQPLEFVIEASLANSKLLQINLSADQGEDITSFEITNNAFVDELSSFINKMNISLNGNSTEVQLDSQNRSTVFP